MFNSWGSGVDCEMARNNPRRNGIASRVSISKFSESKRKTEKQEAKNKSLQYTLLIMHRGTHEHG